MIYSNTHNSEVEVLSALEQAAGPLWTLIDDVSAVFPDPEYENAHDDVANHLKSMRSSYASSIQLLRGLQEFQSSVRDRIEKFQRTVCGRIEQFAQKVGRFENHISRTALNYGLLLLPDDVLSEIFVLAGTTLDEKVALSLVCKRFRRTMMSMRKMWGGHHIAPYQSSEKILAVAEGSRLVSLRAYITSPSVLPSSVETWIANRGLDLEEYRMRYYKFAVGLILSFGPEELQISMGESHWEEIEPILAGGNMQNLRRLVMRDISRNSAGGRLLQNWHMPLLQHLELRFVPEPTLARNLVRCKLYGIEEYQFDSLKEFLAAAQSLQDLRLFLADDRRHFYKVCNLPSLRSLEVNFGPHPSLARHLVRCSLLGIRETGIDSLREFPATAKSLQDLQLLLDNTHTTRVYEFCDLPALRSLKVNFEPHPRLARHLVRFRLTMPSDCILSLSRLLNFLSSSEALQELILQGSDRSRGFSGNPGTSGTSVVTMPSVVSCQFLDDKTGPTLIAKLHMPMLRILKLRLHKLPTITRNEFRTSLQSMSSLEDLQLRVDRMAIDNIDEIVRYAPRCLESFSLEWCSFGRRARRDTSSVPRRRLIRFIGCNELFPEFVPAFVDYLRTVGLGRVELQFMHCTRCKDGTFGIDDVMSAKCYNSV